MKSLTMMDGYSNISVWPNCTVKMRESMEIFVFVPYAARDNQNWWIETTR
jgi:hypothetical protein